MINHYHRNILQDNKFIVEEIKAFTYELISLVGNAIITHVGGNGRFKFQLDGIEYISEFANNVCTDKENYGDSKENDKYYDYSKVIFNINIKELWSNLYINHSDKNNYWKELEYPEPKEPELEYPQ